MTVELTDLTPVAEEAWWVVFDLAEQLRDGWVLVGGQMVQLLAAEHGAAERVRPTEDVDVIVDVRARPDATRRLADWLLEAGFRFGGHNAEGVGHRFERPALGAVGKVLFDVLAPDGLGGKTSTTTVPPARTVEVPGGTQAVLRSELIDVAVSGVSGRPTRTGAAARPTLLGALVAKAAATAIAVRTNPARDWQDAALLLALVPDPVAVAEQCGRSDRKRLQRLLDLEDGAHVGWALLSDDDQRRGITALRILCGPRR